jgi:hypothetical protein
MQPYFNPTITQLEEIWKTTSIFSKMEDDLNSFFLKEDDLNFFWKWKKTSKKIMQPKTIKSKNNNIFENGRRTSFKVRQPKIFESGR